MKRNCLCALAISSLAHFLFSNSAIAQSCSGATWTNLANGNSADASQVMNNFNCVLSSPSFSGSVGIGTSAVTALTVNGQSYVNHVSPGTPQDILTLNVAGPNYTQFYDSGQLSTAGGLAIGGANSITGVPSSALMFWNTNTGSVGIGTITPATTFQVSGQTFISHVVTGSQADVLTLNVTGPNFAQFYDVNQAGSAGGLAIGGATSVTAIPSSAIMFWNTNTGNVGVGTTSPNISGYGTGGTVLTVSGSAQPGGIVELSSSVTVADGNVTGDVAFDNTNLTTSKRLALIRATLKGATSNDAGGQLDFLTKANGGSLATALTITNAGKVGIGTATPAQALEVNGQIKVDTLASASGTSLCINANVIASCSSSLRYKENIRSAHFGLKEIEAMRPVTFKWKGRDEQDLGLIAEEVAKIDAKFVTYKAGRIEGVKYPQLTAVLVNAVKELKAANDGQAAEIARLRAQNNAVDNQLKQQAVEIQNVRSTLSALERAVPVHTTENLATIRH